MKYNFLVRAMMIIALILPRMGEAQCNDFITIDGKKLKCGTNDFFALVANYFVEYARGPLSNTGTYTYPNNYFPSRYHGYFTTNQRSPHIVNNAKADSAIRRDLRELKAKGFNTIRVVGCGYQDTISTTDWNGNNYIKIPRTNSNHMQLALDVAGGVLKSAKAAGMKVIFLTGDNCLGKNSTPEDLAYQAGYTNYLKEFGRRYGNDPTLLAVDFFNEPSVSGNAYWSKNMACQKTKEWNDALKLHSNALSTIGLWEVGSAFWWDPNMLNVDFISLHNYPITKIDNQLTNLTDAINRVKSDYWWYANNLKLPWIIGETGMTAHMSNYNSIDTDCDRGHSVGTLLDQKIFLHETLNASRDYGATGYSWWQYCDEAAGNYVCNSNSGPFWGLAYANDPTTPIVWKPAIQEITDFNPATIGTAAQPPNYYDYYGNTGGSFMAIGYVYDNSTQAPIKDAIIEIVDDIPGKNSRYQYTYTDGNGYYSFHVGAISKLSVTATEGNGVTLFNNFYSNFYPYLKTIYIDRLTRPTNNSLLYANNSVSSVNVNSYANSFATFANYQINSSNFKTTAVNYINLQPGFAVTSNSNFNAHIGPYYYDCGSFAFRKNNAENSTENDQTTIMQETSENTEPLLHNVGIYPNPGTGKYKVSLGREGEYQIEVYNMQGARIRSEFITEKNHQIDIQNEANGIYLVHIKNQGRLVESVRIIKE